MRVLYLITGQSRKGLAFPPVFWRILCPKMLHAWLNFAVDLRLAPMPFRIILSSWLGLLGKMLTGIVSCSP